MALFGLFEKYMLLPFLNKETIAANRYLSHISNKSFSVFLLESIPLLGSVVINLCTYKPHSLLAAIPGLLQRLPDLQKNKEVILNVVNRGSWSVLHHTHPDLLKDQQVVLQAVKHSWKALEYAPPHLQNDDAIVSQIVSYCNCHWIDSEFESYLSNYYLADKTRVLKALNSNLSRRAIDYIPPALREDKEIKVLLLNLS